jgi:hypothetical protein
VERRINGGRASLLEALAAYASMASTRSPGYQFRIAP